MRNEADPGLEHKAEEEPQGVSANQTSADHGFLAMEMS